MKSDFTLLYSEKVEWIVGFCVKFQDEPVKPFRGELNLASKVLNSHVQLFNVSILPSQLGFVTDAKFCRCRLLSSHNLTV